MNLKNTTQTDNMSLFTLRTVYTTGLINDSGINVLIKGRKKKGSGEWGWGNSI